MRWRNWWQKTQHKIDRTRKQIALKILFFWEEWKKLVAKQLSLIIMVCDCWDRGMVSINFRSRCLKSLHQSSAFKKNYQVDHQPIFDRFNLDQCQSIVESLKRTTRPISKAYMKFIWPCIKTNRCNLMTWRVGYSSQIFRDRLKFIHYLQHGSIFDSVFSNFLKNFSDCSCAILKVSFQVLLFIATIDIFVFCFFIDFFNVRVWETYFPMMQRN